MTVFTVFFPLFVSPFRSSTSYSFLLIFFFSFCRVQYLSSSHCHLQSVLHDPGHPVCNLLLWERAGLSAPACWDVFCLCRSAITDDFALYLQLNMSCVIVIVLHTLFTGDKCYLCRVNKIVSCLWETERERCQMPIELMFLWGDNFKYLSVKLPMIGVSADLFQT